MAITATTTITVNVSGDIVGTFTVPSDSNVTSPGRRDTIALAAGNNAIVGPAGTTKAIIIPPTGSAITKVLKGVAGDTGISIANVAPTLISLSGAAVFVINASNIETIQVLWL